LVSRDADHLLIKTDTGYKQVKITTSDGELNTEELFYIPGKSTDDYPTEIDRDTLMDEANGRIIVFDNNLMGATSKRTPILDAHYINKLKMMMDKLEDKDPDLLFKELSGTALRNLNIMHYNSYLDQIASITDNVIVDGEPTDLGAYILSYRTELLAEMLNSENPIDKMTAHGMIYNNVIAFRSRDALAARLSTYDNAFGRSSIFHHFDQLVGADSGPLSMIIKNPQDIASRPLTGTDSVLDQIASESFEPYKYRETGSDYLVTSAITDELRQKISEIYPGRTFSQSWNNMLDDLKDAYSLITRGDDRWMGIYDGKVLKARGIPGITQSAAADLDQFFDYSINILREAVALGSRVKHISSPRWLIVLALTYLGII